MSDTTTNETQAPPSQGAPAAYMQPPKIRMDRARSFATIHGDRPPDDRHARIHFQQDGLFFDAGGILILDHPDYREDTREAAELRRRLEKKIRQHMAKASKQVAAAPAAVDQEDGHALDAAGDDEDDDEEEAQEPINLSSWVRGEQAVEWQEITQEIARRYKKRIASISDAIPFLVKEGVCPPNEVAKKFKKFLD